MNMVKKRIVYLATDKDMVFNFLAEAFKRNLPLWYYLQLRSVTSCLISSMIMTKTPHEYYEYYIRVTYE